ncbi:hypothetical protein ACFCZV_13255 [Streptomyces hydrogenans]|uniref:hypothetical protein n=1 Tax=Streptomyces hydrogenans TaxID=1873719 RepID=UPI0035D6A746
MPKRPITPTQIFPGGAPLPGHPPGPGDIPPWRTPPTPAPPAAPPAAIEVHVRLLPVEEPPEPSRRDRAWAFIAGIAPPWKIALALLAAMVPIPGVGYSLAGVWAYTVGQARTEVGAPWAYGLAIVPLVLAARGLYRTGALRFLVATTIAFIGFVFGALDPFDLVTITTGVTR